MIDQGSGGGDDSAPKEKARAPIDRASESVVNPPSIGRVPIVRGPFISSGEIEISPSSFSPTAVSTSSPGAAMSDPPPSAVMANALERGKPALPLATVVGIAGGVLVVLVLLALLLFR